MIGKNDTIGGMMWGAVLGDVIGAHVENDKAVTKQKVDKAFTICGGGIRQLEPGQPTDDSQLMMAVSKGLIAGSGILNLNFIAQEMARWFQSKPIDVGNTIRNSVPKACNMKQHQAHLLRKGASERSGKSQSNGTLMAIAGLAVWSRNLSPDDIYKAVREYTILIHPSHVVYQANTAYCLAASYLLTHHNEEGRNKVAFQTAHNWSKQLKEKEVSQWLDTVKEKQGNFDELKKDIPPDKSQGWVKIGFCYAMHFLMAGESFHKAIQEVISCKGDTDTNACIVGGLMGAYHGITMMKMDNQIQKISSYRSKVYKRPEWLIPGLVIDKMTEQLTAIAPKELKMIGHS